MQKEWTHFDRESRSGFIVSSGFTEKEGERLISKLTGKDSLTHQKFMGSSSLSLLMLLPIKEFPFRFGGVCFTKHYPFSGINTERKKLGISKMLDQINTRRFSRASEAFLWLNSRTGEEVLRGVQRVFWEEEEKKMACNVVNWTQSFSFGVSIWRKGIIGRGTLNQEDEDDWWTMFRSCCISRSKLHNRSSIFLTSKKVTLYFIQ